MREQHGAEDTGRGSAERPDPAARRDPQPGAARERLRIVYVAGVGHSGSTLLDLLLGSHSRLASCGELKVLCRARHAKRERVLADRCACGAPAKLACGHWREVDRLLVERIGMGLHEIDVGARDDATFRLHNRALFEAIAEAGRVPWLVDSSKSAQRLARLLACGDFDVRPVHIVRSPYGVAYSHRRRGRLLADGALRYTRTQLHLAWVLRQVPHATLAYERLVREPAAELARVLAWLGLELEPRQLEWTAHVHHNVCGNHMRFAPTSEIRADEAWRSGLSPLQKGAVGLLTWPARLAGGGRAASGLPQSSSTDR